MPFTKRKRLLATSKAYEQKLGDAEYNKLIKLYKYNNTIFPPTHRATMTVKRVGERIANAAIKFTADHHIQTYGSKYTYTVIKSDMANAFVLPNNHVFVLSGLFKYVHDEDDLAAVLGHEMAHNIARHVGERVSSNIFINLIARCTLLIDPSGVLYTLFIPAATLLHDLPHSRDHEIEADYIGLHLAAEACYDPMSAKRVFSAMKDGDSGGGENHTATTSTTTKTTRTRNRNRTLAPPEFMSTHPSYDTRLSNFDEWLPEAMDIYNADGGYKCQRIRKDMKLAREYAAKLANQRERR